MNASPFLGWLGAVLLLGGAHAGAASASTPARSAARDWPLAGGDVDGSYYSRLTQIDAHDVQRLGFAWQYDLGEPRRGQEATPLVVDGVMYTSGTWGYVYALDAATGRLLWRYDPHADFFAAREPCCDLVNRGVAVWKGRVYVASVDGRLHALDAATGRPLWNVDTIVDHSRPYSITGAPLIAGKVVVIGNSGADMGHGAVRGYVSGYDLISGALRWRFYTVPPPRGKPVKGAAQVAAARTWDAHRPARFYGGGTAWDGFAYDPKLNLVYFGTGNAAPYDLRELGASPRDALYCASIVALHAGSGRLAWYYQTTPHDSWDYDSTQKLILATLRIRGKARRVIMQASKNGFFYVLDRRTGRLLSAKNYTYVNWASSVDPRTGRPVLTKNANWHAGPRVIYPSWAGGHTWNPMSYDPRTGLVYIPVIDAPSVWVDLAHNGGTVRFIDGFFTTNAIIADDTYHAADVRSLYGPLPSVASVEAMRHVAPVRELIRAWDPRKRRVLWQHVTSTGVRGYDGGILSTAGNLVIQGRGSGDLWVYAAHSGKVLARISTGSHIMAAPMTYAVRGRQYVAVQVGYGGAAISAGPIPPSSAAFKYQNVNRIIAFDLGGGAVPKPPRRVAMPFPKPPAQTASAARIHLGEVEFVRECSRCHVFGPSVTPDLRKLSPGLHAEFDAIVLRGLLAPAGMERFDDLLTQADVDDIHAYLIDQSWQAYRAQQAALAGRPRARGPGGPH